MATTFHHHFHENILSTIHHHHLSSLCSRTSVLLVFTSLLVLLLSSSPPRPVNASDASVFSQSNDGKIPFESAECSRNPRSTIFLPFLYPSGQTPHLVPVSYCEQLCQVHKCNRSNNSSSDNYKSSKVISKWSHFSRSKVRAMKKAVSHVSHCLLPHDVLFSVKPQTPKLRRIKSNSPFQRGPVR